MKILIVGMGRSIHTVRWINQLSTYGWEIHLFPSFDNGATHALLEKAVVHHSFYSKTENSHLNVQYKGVPLFSKKIALWARTFLKKIDPSYREKQLTQVIKKVQPDIVHSLGIDTGGFLTLNAKKRYSGKFPHWIVSNWGSDLYFFGRLSEYRPKMLAVLQSCQHLSVEARRDDILARKEYGFKGKSYFPGQCGGGWNLEELAPLRTAVPTSERKLILVKGYQQLMGRALVALRALERCKDVLQGYEIVLIGADPEKELRLLTEWFTFNTGIPARIAKQTSDYQSVLKLQSKARIFIGLSISDGVSNSFLESMIMGSFPIQSFSSSPQEWINDGKTGIGVHSEDPEGVERAIRKAIGDDVLVDEAAQYNWQVAKERLSADSMRLKSVEMYNEVVKSPQQ